MITHYFRPRSVDAALRLREQYDRQSCWASGWAQAEDGKEPAHITCAIALDHIQVNGEHLNTIRCEKDRLRIGALTTLQDMLDHPDVPAALKTAAAFQPSRALRCMATLGSDVAVRRYDSCLAVALIASGVLLELAGDAAIYVGQYVARHQRDLILFARVPLTRRVAVHRQRRSSRGAVLLTVAVGWEESSGGTVTVVIEGAGLPLQRLPAVEKLLEMRGGDVPGAELEGVVRESVRPEADWMGSAAYKTHLAAVTVADCVATCRLGRTVC